MKNGGQTGLTNMSLLTRSLSLSCCKRRTSSLVGGFASHSCSYNKTKNCFRIFPFLIWQSSVFTYLFFFLYISGVC